MKKKIWKRSMQILGALIIGVMALFSVKANKSNEMQIKSSLKENKLALCPNKPNCVSSYHQVSEDHYISPYETSFFSMDIADSYFKDCGIKSKSDFYRHYECKTQVFKFVDDLEIYFYNNKLWFRSASRVGHSDLGANRKRIEAFKNFLSSRK